MSRRAAQLDRAIASSPARPRTVLNAGHSKTAVSVYSAAYAAASRLRYAWTRRAFNESMPAAAPPGDGRDGCEQARATTKNEAMATRMEVRYAGPLRFKRPDLEGADAFLARLTQAAGSADVMHAYLGSQPAELTELARRHRAALAEFGTIARR